MPSAALFESMASAGYEQAASVGFILNTENGTIAFDSRWANLDEQCRDAMIGIARAMYAECAKAGGARVETIKEEAV